jgi:hypothetical protein
LLCLRQQQAFLVALKISFYAKMNATSKYQVTVINKFKWDLLSSIYHKTLLIVSIIPQPKTLLIVASVGIMVFYGQTILVGVKRK